MKLNHTHLLIAFCTVAYGSLFSMVFFDAPEWVIWLWMIITGIVGISLLVNGFRRL